MHELREKRNDFVHQCWLYNHQESDVLEEEVKQSVRILVSLIEKVSKMEKAELNLLKTYRPKDLNLPVFG